MTFSKSFGKNPKKRKSFKKCTKKVKQQKYDGNIHFSDSFTHVCQNGFAYSHFLRTSSPVNIKSKLGDFVSYVSLNIVGALKEENSFINLL
jgi:hypothetical protein